MSASAAAIKDRLDRIGTVVQAVKKGIELCLETKRPPSEVLTSDMLDSFAPDVVTELARIGWLKVVNDQMHQDRSGPVEVPRLAASMPIKGAGSVRQPTHPVGGRNPRGAWEPLENITLQAANGRLKALAEFTYEDAEYLYDHSRQQERGYAKRAAWAAKAKEMLGDDRRKTISKLNKSQVAELSMMAKGAWS